MGRRKRNPTPFYVINSKYPIDFEKYDVMPCLMRAYDYAFKKKAKDKRPSTFKEMLKFVKDESMYHFWSKCEYEILLGHWPPIKDENFKKVDVYWQIEMNIKTITRLLIENLGLEIKENC